MKNPALNVPVRTWITCGLLLAFGLFVLIGGLSYYRGTLRAMGPGYFPVLLGGTLCITALLIVIEDVAMGIRTGEPLPKFTWGSAKSVLYPLAGVLAFALTVREVGFVPATISCALLAGLGHPGNRPVEIVIIASLVSALTSIIFVFALGIPVRLFAF